jgi:hypothetical protein
MKSKETSSRTGKRKSIKEQDEEKKTGMQTKE